MEASCWCSRNCVTNKRPGFLFGFSNENYVSVCVWLLRHPTEVPPVYEDFALETHVSHYLQIVLDHVTFWANALRPRSQCCVSPRFPNDPDVQNEVADAWDPKCPADESPGTAGGWEVDPRGSLQKLNPAFHFKRPGFLKHANNTFYMKIYEWLVTYHNHPVYSYTTVYKEVRVSVFLYYILGHVVFWANPERAEPYRTSLTFKAGYDMQIELAEAWAPIEQDSLWVISHSQ